MPHFLTFASDAKLVALLGGASIALAGLCLFMEQRRVKRAHIDRVGWVPWTGLFLSLAVIGGGLLTMSLPVLLAG